MTDSPRIQGWCPGALRPMRAEDGWVVRVRPPLGRLTPVQARGVAALAACHAADALELTGRANLQLRGVADAAYPALLEGLQALGLVDADVQTESRRNLLIEPFWQPGDGTGDLAGELAVALSSPQAPALPGKFGFALDTGVTPVLRATPADVRVERHLGGYLVYADGASTGALAGADEVVPLVMALAQWFVDAGGPQTVRKRMAALVAVRSLPGAFTAVPVPDAAPWPPPLGPVPQGCLVAFEFGQLPACTLDALAGLAPLRLTPWRSVLLEGVREVPGLPGIVTRADDSRLRISACTGAPGCGQAAAATRPLARALAPVVPPGRVLHVSGCSKGCAHPGETLTVVATELGYNLIRRGKAASPPDWCGLSAEALAARIQDMPDETQL